MPYGWAMPSGLRIVQVLHRLDRAGAEVLAEALARDLRGRAQMVFACLDGQGAIGEGLRRDGFDVHDLGRKPGLDRTLPGKLAALYREHEPQLIHAHQYTPFFYASLARGIGPWRRRPPVLFTEHGRHYPDLVSTKRRVGNRALFRRGDRATAVGGFVKQALVQREGLPASRVEVLYNGIDPNRDGSGAPRPLASDPGARREARGRLGLSGDGPVIMQVARFHSVKDHATSIRAMAEVRREHAEARLVLVGDGSERGACAALVKELGLDDAVIFAGVRSDVAALLPAAEVFVLSSLSEGVSVTLLEAMACGLAIAATEVGGNPEVVEHGRTGLLSPRGEAVALGANLRVLLGDATKRVAMGQAGRALLLERFTQAAMHRRYAELYAEMG